MIRTFIIAVVFALFSTFAFAMDPSLKADSLETTKFCNVYTRCFHDRGSATYLWTDQEGYSLWITDRDLVEFGSRVSVDFYSAEVIAYNGDIAVMRVPYDPVMMPTTFGYYSLLDEGLFYSNLCKYKTVNKMNIKALDSYRMVCNTIPNCSSRGAGVFNMSGELVGVVLGVYNKQDCVGFGTSVAVLDRKFIEDLQEEYPTKWF